MFVRVCVRVCVFAPKIYFKKLLIGDVLSLTFDLELFSIFNRQPLYERYRLATQQTL